MGRRTGDKNGATHCSMGHDREGRKQCRECVRKWAKKKRDERRRLVQAIKLDRGCSVCGYRDHPAALQFHHVNPETKLFTVGRIAESSSITALLAEIEKCVVLCANCHAAVTWEKN